jgi:Fe-S-cluster containining protein
MKKEQTTCKQCGICCTKGGAALHTSDITLIDQGLIPHKNLFTIRKGEFAYTPVSESAEATEREIVKLKGSGKEWTCCYYDPESRSCAIYENRPVACATLKCWDPEDSLALVGKDLLGRLEIVRHDKSLIDLITEYEHACPLPDFKAFSEAILKSQEEIIVNLESLINRDIQFRDKAVAKSARILEEEMFLFGRPIFQLLQPFGLVVMQSGNKLYLKVQK